MTEAGEIAAPKYERVTGGLGARARSGRRRLPTRPGLIGKGAGEEEQRVTGD